MDVVEQREFLVSGSGFRFLSIATEFDFDFIFFYFKVPERFESTLNNIDTDKNFKLSKCTEGSISIFYS